MLAAKPPLVPTLPALLRAIGDQYSHGEALSWREAGYWRRMSTEAFVGQVRQFALGLHALGFRRGDALGVLAPSSPFWLIADFAAQCCGGVSVPLFTTMSGKHLGWIIEHVPVRHLLVISEPAWQLARPHAKHVEAVITRGCLADRGHHLDWQGVLEKGVAAGAADPRLFARLRDAVLPDDPATIIHTSGSTGRPKGVVLSHRNLLAQIQGSGELFPLDPSVDRALSCLPLAHIFERMVVTYYLACGVSVAFADDVKQIGALMRELKPTVMTAVPRVVEKVHAKVLNDIEAGGVVVRKVGHWALDRADHHDPDLPVTLADNVADRLLYKQVRSAFGGHLRYFIVGGAPLRDDLHRFLVNCNIPVYLGYGMTEASPVITVNRPGDVHVGTVGRPFPGVAVRLTAEGEILAKGDSIMRGYHKDPAATAAAIDSDGWLHSGDRGAFDDAGRLVITGRLKELLKTSNGKYVSPVAIEQALCGLPLIDQAQVVADGRPYPIALLFLSQDILRQERVRHGRTDLDLAQVAALPEIAALIATHLAQVNTTLDRWEQVKRWLILAEPPTVENGQLTPTLKLRRKPVEDAYATSIDALYAAAESPQESLAPS